MNVYKNVQSYKVLGDLYPPPSAANNVIVQYFSFLKVIRGFHLNFTLCIGYFQPQWKLKSFLEDGITPNKIFSKKLSKSRPFS